jgi:hypothetical protein
MKHIVSITITLVVTSTSCFGQNSRYLTIEEFIKDTIKDDSELIVNARGDLNGDGSEDWAGVVDRKKGDFRHTVQLYILLESGQGGYRLELTTAEHEVMGSGCCWVKDLQIKNSSLYIQQNAKTAGTMEAATHQFKLYKGQWRLMGAKIFYLIIDKDLSTDTDMNVLTGKVITTKQKGEKTLSVTTRSKKFPTSYLKDLSFWNGFGIE